MPAGDRVLDRQLRRGILMSFPIAMTSARSHVILVAGSCPGAGKTSVSRALARRLEEAGVPARPLSEDDLLQLEPFAHFDDELFREDRAAIDTLLVCLFHEGRADTMQDEALPCTTGPSSI